MAFRFEKPYWPNKRGFNKSFTLLPGAGNHYKYITRDSQGNQIPFYQQFMLKMIKIITTGN